MTAKFNRAQEIELAFQKSILLSMNRVERRLVIRYHGSEVEI